MSEEAKEAQNDEREALVSIYEGDNAFKQVSPTTFQYKVFIYLYNVDSEWTSSITSNQKKKNQNKSHFGSFTSMRFPGFQYGDEGDNHTFLVELNWGENYPNDAPAINLNVFYNQHL